MWENTALTALATSYSNNINALHLIYLAWTLSNYRLLSIIIQKESSCAIYGLTIAYHGIKKWYRGNRGSDLRHYAEHPAKSSWERVR
jgi:hypothetical protein